MDKVDYITTTDSRGRTFDRFFAARSATAGPGWFVFGRNAGYNDRLIRLCARPEVKARQYKWFNGPRRRGWHTKREAQAVADKMNGRDQ